MWLAAYACISAYYRSLDAPNRKGFIAWCNYCDSWSGLISTPLSIALGFFMTQVFSRWWGMWMTCWRRLDLIAKHVSTNLRSSSSLGRLGMGASGRVCAPGS